MINTRLQSGKQFSRAIPVPVHLLNNLPPHVHFCNSSVSISVRDMTFLEPELTNVAPFPCTCDATPLPARGHLAPVYEFPSV